jgi:ABC-type polysaccharide/polyol phosphate transport system ATPase subunit
MDKEIAISVKNVSKTFRIPHEKVTSLRSAAVGVLKRKGGYEEFKALDDVSFEVKKGEFFGIIGRNGSGKSTLLKILAGIYQPDPPKKGKVHPVKSGKAGVKQFHGVKINGMISPFLELGIGFNPELSGRDNIYLNATVLGMTKKQIDAKFDDIVKFSELERFIDQKLKNYSSGMQVRLAFSVSIHANREILLMDEVLAVGDSNFQAKCIREFTRYKELGRTVIIVTHDISVVQRYCDRAMLLRNGKIKEIGKADEVADRYVFENMSDEERRISGEKKKNLGNGEKGKSNKVVEIMNVELLDKDGKAKNVFETGEAMDIKIDFKINKKVEELNFGIGLHATSGGQVFGYNTQMDKIEIDRNKNTMILHFDKMPVLKGEYFMNVACFGEIEQNHYDFKPKNKILRMLSRGIKNDYRGFCDIEHKWIY